MKRYEGLLTDETKRVSDAAIHFEDGSFRALSITTVDGETEAIIDITVTIGVIQVIWQSICDGNESRQSAGQGYFDLD